MKIEKLLPILFCIIGVSVAFAGVLEEDLFSWELVGSADGFDWKEPKPLFFQDDLLVIADGDTGWVLNKIPEGGYNVQELAPDGILPQGWACVQFEGGLLSFGFGAEQGQYVSQSRFLKWNAQQGRFVVSEADIDGIGSVPPLPKACRDMSAFVHNSVVYVIGGYDLNAGKTINYGWFLDLSATSLRQWQQLPEWEGQGIIAPSLIVQHNGKENCIFVYGGYNDLAKSVVSHAGYSCGIRITSPQKQVSQWQVLEKMPDGVGGIVGSFAVSQSHILAAPRGENQHWLAYNTITDVWFWFQQLKGEVMGVMPKGVGGYVFTVDDDFLKVYSVGVNNVSGRFTSLDYAMLAVFFIGLIWMGFFFSKREGTTDDFFVAGGRIPAWAAAISIMGTNFSAISFLTVPGRAYSNDWVQFMGIITLPILALMQVYLFIPIYRKHKIVSVYDYLERRFNYAVRGYGSAVFIFSQFARLGAVLYLPALTLSAVTGINIYFAVIAMGVVCILYTVMGGIEAVIWTDVIQTIIIVFGVLLCFYIIVSSCDGGMRGIFEVGISHNKFSLGQWQGDWTTSAIWVVFTGHMFWYLGSIGNQNVAQRFLSVGSQKEAVKSAWLHIAIAVPVTVLLYFLGTSLFFYYKTHPTQMNPNLINDAVLPWFVSMEVPSGIAGLIVAAVFAASMSSVDTSMNSAATAYVSDFYERFNRKASDGKKLKIAKIATLLIGILGVVFALVMAFFGDRLTSILDFLWEVNALLAASLGGVFMLGMFSKRANGTGAIVGVVAGMVALYFAKTGTDMSFFLYHAVGMLACMLVGYIVSLITPPFGKQNINRD